MANSRTDDKKKNGKNEEIEKIREMFLQKEMKFSEEMEKLGKNRIGSKTIFSLIIMFCAIFYYITTRDQSLIESNEKLNKESKLKDQKIDDLNKQFELKDRHLNAVLSESESKEKRIKDFNEKIALKDKRLEEVLFESENRNNKIIELENNFIKIQTEFKDFESNCLMKDKQIQSLLNEKQLKDKQIDTELEKFNHLNLIAEAQNSTAQVLFGTNQSMADAIIPVIIESLHSEYIYVCFEQKPKFDVYKNCFRDLGIVLHNKLYEQLDSYWVVTTGTVDHCFTINVINESQSQQYFITIGNIYFEIFKYNDVFFDHPNTEEDISQNQIKEDISQNQVKEDISQNHIKEDITQNQIKENIPQNQIKEDIPQNQIKEDIPQNQIKEDIPQNQIKEEDISQNQIKEDISQIKEEEEDNVLV